MACPKKINAVIIRLIFRCICKASLLGSSSSFLTRERRRMMTPKNILPRTKIADFIDNLYDGDLHAKRVLSLANATLGVLVSASLAVHAIGQGLAQALGKLSKHGVKQVDRLLSNQGVDVWAFFGYWIPYLVSGRKPPLRHEICDEPPHFRRGFGHGTGRTGTTEGCLASNRPAFPTSGHRRPLPSRCAERGGRNPQEMAALRQRGVFDVVRPHACAVAQADRCGAGSRPVSTMQRCVQTHRRRGSAPGRDRDAQGC